MPTGTVMFVHERDNYGFIETDAIEEDVFFHQSFIEGVELEEEDEVEFGIKEEDRGPQAIDLRKR